MNKLLITITYHIPGQPPVMTTTVLDVGNYPASYKDEILQQYRNKTYYDVTITVIN